MSLPFLKDKTKQTGLIVQQRTADGSHSSGPEDESEQGLTACGEDLMRAIKAGDAQGVSEALRAAFQILDSSPHEEGEHTNDDQEDEGSGE